jgi:hypothetical protein
MNRANGFIFVIDNIRMDGNCPFFNYGDAKSSFRMNQRRDYFIS